MRQAPLAGGLLLLLAVAGCAGGSKGQTASSSTPGPGGEGSATAAPSTASSGSVAPSVTATRSGTIGGSATATLAPRASATRSGGTATTVASSTPRPQSSPSQQATTQPAPRPTPKPTAAPTTAPPAAGATPLAIRDFEFTPRALTVVAGTTVRATNFDGATHDWTSRTGVWGSGDLRTNQAFSYRFNVVGSFDYLCTIHPSMTGSVTVTPS